MAERIGAEADGVAIVAGVMLAVALLVGAVLVVTGLTHNDDVASPQGQGAQTTTTSPNQQPVDQTATPATTAPAN